jgi:RNA polymerase sigma-70 factor (ECF subfamily)
MTLTTLDVWEAFSERLRAYILKRVSDPADADDILQDVFVKIHTHIDTLRSEDRLVPWLYQIARNTITDHYRTQRPLVAIPETLAVEFDPAESDLAPQLAAGLRYLIECLPDRYRQALLLAELEGLTQRELAERLGISLSGAKSRVQRGRHLLRAALLDCCHFEFDRRGHVLDYTPRPDCCPHCNAVLRQTSSSGEGKGRARACLNAGSGCSPLGG